MLFIEKSYIIIVMIGEYKDLRRIEMGFIEQLKIKAKSNKKTIVLPEGMDRRTYEAAQQKKISQTLLFWPVPKRRRNMGKVMT